MNKAVFLDRDGTLNVDHGYVHCKEEFELLDGVIEGLSILQNLGFRLIIITNQSGIGRGYFSEKEYLVFQKYINDYFENQGIHIAAQYYCPHVDSDNCSCRKPHLQMYERAANDFNIDWTLSYAIGDKERDLSICKDKDIKGFLISDVDNHILKKNIVKVHSLYEAAIKIKEDIEC